MDPRVVRRAAERRRELVVRLRRDLHRIPELGLEEVETSRYVQEFLGSRGIPWEPFGMGSGGVARVGEAGPLVLLRADLDALPVEEEAEVPFRSRHPGRMHACGHDAHTAILLATADALASGEVPLPGRVACVFQPAEEGPGGCRRMLEEGLLDGEEARAAVALHVWPGLPTGTVGLSPGAVMAGADRVRAVFVGRGGHGAHPQNCVDPLPMAAEAVLALQTLVSRRTDPLEAAALTLGTIRGGTAPNVIPDRVEVAGTLRAYEPAVRERLVAGFRQVTAGVAAAHGGRCEAEVEPGYPVTRNDPEVTRRVREALAELLGAEAVGASTRTMGSEDVSYLFERVPGAYLQLGAAADPATAEPLHSPRFLLDEGCLPVGVAVLLVAAGELLRDP